MSQIPSDAWKKLLEIDRLLLYRSHLVTSNKSLREDVAKKIVEVLQFGGKEFEEYFRSYRFGVDVMKFLKCCKEAGDNEMFNKVLNALLRFYIKRGVEELKKEGFIFVEAKDSDDVFYHYVLYKVYREGMLIITLHEFGVETFFVSPATSIDDVFKSNILPGPNDICKQQGKFFTCVLKTFESPDKLILTAEEIRKEFESEKNEMFKKLNAMSEQLKNLGYEVHIDTENLLDGVVEVKIHNVKTGGIARIFVEDNLDVTYGSTSPLRKSPNYKVIGEAARIIEDVFIHGESLTRYDVNYFAARFIWSVPRISRQHGWRKYLSFVKACIDSGFSVDGNAVSYNDDAFRKFVTTYSPAIGILRRELRNALWKINESKTAGRRKKLRSELAYRPAIAEQLSETLKACYILTCKDVLDQRDVDLVRSCLSKRDEKDYFLLYHAIMIRLSEKDDERLLSAFEDFLLREADDSTKYEILSTVYDKRVPEDSQAYTVAKRLAAELFNVDPSKVFLKTPIPKGNLLIDIGDRAKILILPIKNRLVTKLILFDEILQPYSDIGYTVEGHEFVFTATENFGEELSEWLQKIRSIFYNYAKAAEAVKSKVLKTIKKPLLTFAYFSDESKGRPITINLPHIVIDTTKDNLSPENAEKIIAEMEKHSYVEIFGKRMSLKQLEETFAKTRNQITV